jgi:hypothetical protein
MLKIMIFMIGYTLNIFINSYDNIIVVHGKNNNFKIFKNMWKLTLGFGSTTYCKFKNS